MSSRPELTEYQYRQARASVLAESTVCIVCGHGGSDAADHIIPVSRGGHRYDRDNLAPIHGISGCPTCYRKCNNEKSDKLISEMDLVKPTRDWFRR